MVEVMFREGAHVPNQAYQHLVEIETWELIAKSDSTIDELVGGESLKWVMDLVGLCLRKELLFVLLIFTIS